MRKVTTDIDIKMKKNYRGRSIRFEITVNGEVTKCSRTYAWDWDNGWFYEENNERIYVPENYMIRDLSNFYERAVKVLDMIWANAEEISEGKQEAENDRES